jgi:hypothetical protein
LLVLFQTPPPAQENEERVPTDQVEQQGMKTTMGGEVFENGEHQGAMANQQQHGNKHK